MLIPPFSVCEGTKEDIGTTKSMRCLDENFSTYFWSLQEGPVGKIKAPKVVLFPKKMMTVLSCLSSYRRPSQIHELWTLWSSSFLARPWINKNLRPAIALRILGSSSIGFNHSTSSIRDSHPPASINRLVIMTWTAPQWNLQKRITNTRM